MVVDERVRERPRSKSDVVLCINSGSSSLKFAVIAVGDGDERRIADGAIERIGEAPSSTHAEAIGRAFARLADDHVEGVTLVCVRIEPQRNEADGL